MSKAMTEEVLETMDGLLMDLGGEMENERNLKLCVVKHFVDKLQKNMKRLREELSLPSKDEDVQVVKYACLDQAKKKEVDLDTEDEEAEEKPPSPSEPTLQRLESCAGLEETDTPNGAASEGQ